MNVLSIQNIEKTVDDRPLFTEVTLGLDAGEKVGIVGRNGAGKTTFLKVLRGLVHQDEGTIAMAGGSNMVTLEQNVTFGPSATIRDFLYESDHPSTGLLADYHKSLESGDERLSQRLQAEIDRLDLWNLENDFKTYLTRFGMKYDINHEMKTLSGGELKKVAIARMFALRPTIMLLDEPTNHLDIRTIELLEKDLQNSSASVIIVTHDRYILNSVCTTIWELDGGRFYRHPGNYEAYLERRAERIQMLQKEQDRLASILRRELVWLARGPQARTGKDKNRKERIETMLSQVRNVQDVRQTSFSSLERRLGKKILDLKHVSKSFDGRTLFEDFSYSFKKGDRIGVVADGQVHTAGHHRGCRRTRFRHDRPRNQHTHGVLRPAWTESTSGQERPGVPRGHILPRPLLRRRDKRRASSRALRLLPNKDAHTHVGVFRW